MYIQFSVLGSDMKSDRNSGVPHFFYYYRLTAYCIMLIKFNCIKVDDYYGGTQIFKKKDCFRCYKNMFILNLFLKLSVSGNIFIIMFL